MKNLYIITLFSCLLIGKLIAQPTITSFSPASGPVGISVVISGTGFDDIAANNIVFFGATQATVTSATTTSLTVTVPSGATYMPITILTNGLLAYSATPFLVSFGGSGIDAGSFGSNINQTTEINPIAVVIDDIDGDSKPDLVVANFGSSSISIYRNNSITQGSISYDPKIDYAVGTNPYDVQMGDFDGDGKQDIAVANFGSNTVSIFRNISTSGSISHETQVDFATGTGPTAIAIGDIDLDGKVDMAVTNINGNTVSVHRNASTGIGSLSFFASQNFATDVDPIDVAIDDFDGDGKVDMAVVNQSTNSISTYLNTSSIGSISFTTQSAFVTGAVPYLFSTGDLDGDGKAEIAVANFGDNTVSVLRNISSNGNISFLSKVDFSTGSLPQSVAIGDIDGDEKPDLAVASRSSNAISVYKNNSTVGIIDVNSFAPAIHYSTNSEPVDVAIGDFDNDGKPDLVSANIASSNLSIFRNAAITTIITLPYLAANGGDFETNQSDWRAYNASGTPFELGSSSITGKEGTTSGSFAWVTGLNDANYLDNSISELISPNFDFSSATNYELRFKAKYNFESGWDGLAVSYSLDGGATWTILNDNLETGWYNSISENTNFGSTNIFSADFSNQFNSYNTDLSFLNGNPDAKFKFTFLSDESNVTTGLTIDDFEIGEAAVSSTETDFITFSFPEQADIATIDAANHTIAITLNPGTSLANLIANFTLSTGAVAAIGATPQVSGINQVNFEAPITYTITAEDGITVQNWVVTATVAANLFASYTFTGNFLDETGAYNGTELTANNAFDNDRLGFNNNAFRFNYQNTPTIELQNTANVDFGDEITITAWIRPEAYNVADVQIITNEVAGLGFNFFLAADDLNATELLTERRLYAGITGVSFGPYGKVLLDRWTHVAFKFQRGVGTAIYINGIIQGTYGFIGGTEDISIPISTGAINIGKDYDGMMDEIKIFSNALTDQEIYDEYNYNRWPFNSLALRGPEGGTAIDWGLEQIQGGEKYVEALLITDPGLYQFRATGSSFEVFMGDNELDGVAEPGASQINVTTGLHAVSFMPSNFEYGIVPITSVGFLGSALTGDELGWNADIDFTDLGNGVYELKYITLFDGEWKIRVNDDWNINWGSNNNNSVLNPDGVNIPITAGIYSITVDLVNKTYSVVVETSSPTTPYKIEYVKANTWWLRDDIIYQNNELIVARDQYINNQQYTSIEKLDEYGEITWISDLITMNSGGSASFRKIVVDQNNNIYAFGQYSGSITINGGNYQANGPDDMILLKYNPDGTIALIKTFGGNGNEDPYGLEVLNSGEIMMSFWFDTDFNFEGQSLSTSTTSQIMAKFNANLSLLDFYEGTAFGMEYNSSNNTIYINTVGTQISAIDPSTMTQIATYNYPASLSINDYTSKLRIDSNGDLVAAAEESSSGNIQIFIGKLSTSTGTWLWYETAGGIGTDGDGLDLSLGLDNSIYLASNFQNAWSWGTDNLSSKGGTDVLLVKFNTTGEKLWLHQIGSEADDWLAGMVVDPIDDDVIIGVYLGGSTNIAIGPNTYNRRLDFTITRFSEEGPAAPISVAPINGFGQYNESGSTGFFKSAFDDQIANEFTLEAIVKFDAFGDNSTQDDNFNSFVYTDFFSLYYDYFTDGRKQFTSYLQDDDATNDGDIWVGTNMETIGFNPGEWHHLVLTYKNSILTQYFDGIPVSSNIFEWNRSSSISDLNIIQNQTANVDEIRIWNVAHTIDEIQATMTTEIDPGSANLVGYWKFNTKNDLGGGNFTTPDATSNANDLIMDANASIIEVLTIPQFTSVTDVSFSRFTLNWNPNSVATAYNLQVATDAAFINLLVDNQVTTVSETITGLTSNTTYYARLNATDGSTTTDWSATETILTLSDQIIVHYTLNGDATDQSGNGNNGTVNGATLTTDRYGNANSAYSFNGISDLIAINGGSGVSLNGDITYSMWVYPIATQNSRLIWDNSSEYGDFFINDDNTISYDYSDGTSAFSIFSTNQVTLNTWNMISLTREGGAISIFIDGTLDKSATAIDPTGASIITDISRGDTDGTGFFNGAIDEVRIYDTALTATDILDIYQSEKPLSTENEATAFSFAEQTGAATLGTGTIDISVAIGTDVTALIATFTASAGATVTINGTEQISGTTPNDFTNPVTYLVTAEDGVTSQNWIVTVTVQSVNLTLGTLPGSIDASNGSVVSVGVDDNSTISSVSLLYRGISSGPTANFITANTTNSGTEYSATLTSDMDPLGVEFKFQADLTSGGSIETDVSYANINHTGDGLTIPSDRIKFSETDEKAYRAISIPLEMSNGNSNAVFDELGAYKENWRLYSYTTSSSSFIEHSSGTQMGLGKGYFILAKSSTSIKTGNGSTPNVTPTTPVEIQIQQGWNLIGNPYNFSIDWDDVLAANTDVSNIDQLGTSLSIWKSAYSESNVLLSFQGGFVFSAEAMSVKIPVTRNTSLPTNGGRIVEKEETDLPAWVTTIELKEKGNIINKSKIGMHENADFSYDKYDLVRLPSLVKTASLKIDHPEFFAPSFSSDFVPITNYFEWELQLEDFKEGSSYTLDWELLENSESSQARILYDLSNQKRIDMSEVNSYTFSATKGQKFTVFYGDIDEINNSLLPYSVTLGDIYPNPVIDNLVIPFNIPELNDGNNVELSLFNLQGRKIITLLNNKRNSGFHQITWDRMNVQGAKTPSGLYIITLKVGSTIQSKKIIFN